MRVWLFVEGESDRLGLEALLRGCGWEQRLRSAGWGVTPIALSNKSNFLKKFGDRAAEKLVASPDDLVVGLPDLHPVAPYQDGDWRHSDAATLKEVQRHGVVRALRDTHHVGGQSADAATRRLFPSVFRHDFEMLLLAAIDELRSHLRTSESLGKWRTPVEDQNFNRPPKVIVQELFRSKSPHRREYRETSDAAAVLRRVTDLRRVVWNQQGVCMCPEFAKVLDWLSEETGVRACEAR